MSKGVPITALILIVLGGIYLGFFTPVEAGAIGALGALLIGLIKRRLGVKALWRVLVETGLICLYVLVVILLGLMLDSSSIMLAGVPLMLPIVVPMGIDLVWFGILTVIAVEIGLHTPPFGIWVYVIKSTLDDDSISLFDIFLGAATVCADGVDLSYFDYSIPRNCNRSVVEKVFHDTKVHRSVRPA